MNLSAEIKVNDVTICEYRTVVFAFNPNYVFIHKPTGSTATKATIGVSVTGGISKQIEVPLYESINKVYISKLIQVVCFSDTNFDTDTRWKSFTLSVTIGDLTGSADVQAVWGVLQFGERWNDIGAFNYDASRAYFVRNARWFKNFPFTMEVYLSDDGYYREYICDGQHIGDIPVEVRPTAYGQIWELDPTLLTNPEINQSAVFRFFFEDGIFNEPFSTEFIEFNVACIEVNLKVDERKEGVYLRWIDTHGFIQYWLFYLAQESDKNTLGDKIPAELEYDLQDYGVAYRTTGKTLEKTLKCAAQALNEEEYNLVLSVVSSPLVDMYVGKSVNDDDLWQPVTINATTNTRNLKKHGLWDVGIEVVLPTTKTQEL